jgi:16S rRNA (guanine527-N7)-methyltransferase
VTSGRSEGGEAAIRPALSRAAAARPHAKELAADRAHALNLTPVSRETEKRLDRFVGLLLDWQARVNLIAPSTEPALWTRHVADSLQLLMLAPEAKVWADFGSGAGFPGLAIACALADDAAARVHLVESNGKKVAFLREAMRETGAPALVHGMSGAEFSRSAPEGIQVVTARALAPLPDLLAMTRPLLISGALGIFPKGQGIAAELTETAKYWKIQATLVPSRTDPKGRIVVVRRVEPVSRRTGKRR